MQQSRAPASAGCAQVTERGCAGAQPPTGARQGGSGPPGQQDDGPGWLDGGRGAGAGDGRLADGLHGGRGARGAAGSCDQNRGPRPRLSRTPVMQPRATRVAEVTEGSTQGHLGGPGAASRPGATSSASPENQVGGGAPAAGPSASERPFWASGCRTPRSRRAETRVRVCTWADPRRPQARAPTSGKGGPPFTRISLEVTKGL